MKKNFREISVASAYSIVDKCEYAALSMMDTAGAPYCIPLTIVRDGSSVYFHSAKHGHKADCLKANPKVCLACVGGMRQPADKFTVEYESAVITGTAAEVMDNPEKVAALRALCLRHTPANMGEFDTAISKSLDRTAVWRIDISEITGKRKNYTE